LDRPTSCPGRAPSADTLGVRRWLAVLNGAMDYERFELVLGGGKAIATGKPFESEIVRIWTFRGGRAVKVRSYYDTQAYAAALAPYYHSTVRGDAPSAALAAQKKSAAPPIPIARTPRESSAIAGRRKESGAQMGVESGPLRISEPPWRCRPSLSEPHHLVV
jgi:hypothetical protein